MPPLLEVRDLHTQFATAGGVVRAVDGVDLCVEPGEIVGVAGESGCGKTMLALSILRLVPEPGRIVGGGIRFAGRDVLAMDAESLRELRGADAAMTFQDPMAALNPLTSVRGQIREAMAAHDRFSGTEASRRVVPLLNRVRIPDAERRAGEYPHQFSGGMRQRVMIAMGISNEPGLVLADEPTTALDVTTQAQIVRLLQRLNHDSGTAIVLITHNMALLAGLCQRVVVMYAGRVVEEGPVEQVFEQPRHPYTAGLLDAIPRVDRPSIRRLEAIPGAPPDLASLPSGCAFHPRCSAREERCAVDEPPVVDGVSGRVRCWAPLDVARAEHAAPSPQNVRSRTERSLVRRGTEQILRLEEVSKHFSGGRGRSVVKAVDEVSLVVRRGETLALIGESGCGKSTLARVITHLVAATSGRVLFEGRDLTNIGRGELRGARRRMQMIFQDPFSSLDPRMTVGDIIREPIDNFHTTARAERHKRVEELLELVRMGSHFAARYPHELSGGQRQRVGIARALALDPALLICDEPVSALDVSIQAQIINLLEDLQNQLGLTYLFIAHDLALVRHLADRVAVMYLGKIVELADAEDLYNRPQHPYTRLLLDSIPVADPRLGKAGRADAVPEHEMPSVSEPPTGCPFHPRCPIGEVPGRCNSEEPRLEPHGRLGQSAACHFAEPLGA